MRNRAYDAHSAWIAVQHHARATVDENVPLDHQMIGLLENLMLLAEQEGFDWERLLVLAAANVAIYRETGT